MGEVKVFETPWRWHRVSKHVIVSII